MTAIGAPLAEAASLVASVCDRIDNGEELTSALRDTFGMAIAQLAQNVDRCFDFRGALTALQAELKAREERAKAERKRLEALEAVFLEEVQHALEAAGSVPFKGKAGTIALRLGPPAIETVFGDKKLDPATIDMFGIDSRFVREKHEYALDAKAVLVALQNGEELSWAKAVRKYHPNFR